MNAPKNAGTSLSEQMAELKSQVSLRDFAEDHLEPAPGRKFVCPFCGSGTGQHRTSALHLSRDESGNDRFKCFSIDCGKYGDIFDLAGAVFGIEDRRGQFEAVAKWAGFIPEEGQPARVTRARKAVRTPTPEELAAREQRFAGERERSARLVWCCQRDMAIDLVRTGEIGHDDLRRRGYSKKTIATIVESAYRKELSGDAAPGVDYLTRRGFTPREIFDMKLGYDGRRGKVVVPWSQDKDEFYYYARDITGKEGAIKHYVPSSAKLGCGKRPFGLEQLQRATDKGCVWIVEGLFDALSIDAVGGHAIAVAGTATSQTLEALKVAGPDGGPYPGIIICALDSDGPGRQANADLVQACKEAGLRTHGLEAKLPGGAKDANEVLAHDRDALSAFVKRYEGAARLMVPREVRVPVRGAAARAEARRPREPQDRPMTADNAERTAPPEAGLQRELVRQLLASQQTSPDGKAMKEDMERLRDHVEALSIPYLDETDEFGLVNRTKVPLERTGETLSIINGPGLGSVATGSVELLLFDSEGNPAGPETRMSVDEASRTLADLAWGIESESTKALH